MCTVYQHMGLCCHGMQLVLMIELILVHVTSDNDAFCCRYCNSCHRYMLATRNPATPSQRQALAGAP